jgi:hypothetical protein
MNMETPEDIDPILKQLELELSENIKPMTRLENIR